jgi:hypothetical protein
LKNLTKQNYFKNDDIFLVSQLLDIYLILNGDDSLLIHNSFFILLKFQSKLGYWFSKNYNHFIITNSCLSSIINFYNFINNYNNGNLNILKFNNIQMNGFFFI